MSVLRCSLLALFLTLTTTAFAVGSASAEPAVKEANGRVIVAYDWLHTFGGDLVQFNPAPPTIVDVPESDLDSGGFSGVYTLPLPTLGENFGARALGGLNFSKFDADGVSRVERVGIDLGGQLFWRDPSIGEAGVGAFYVFDDREQGSTERSDHTAGVAAFGTLFLNNVLGKSVDLDLSATFSDSDIDDEGAFSAERNYATRGGVKVYLNDRVSLRAGGVWSRTNFGNQNYLESRLAELDLEILLPTRPNVTLGGGFVVGKTEDGVVFATDNGRDVFGISLAATISFPGADSLIELNRNYY